MLGLLFAFTIANPLRDNTVIKFGGATIQGTKNGNSVAFYNIPFAQPPVGPLRFEPPRPNRLSGRIDATKPGVSCVQIRKSQYVESEDCLQLNVFTPNQNANSKLPVIVFIHGGGLDSDTAVNPLYNGKAIVERSNVIFVTMNYRLGIFGFLGGHGGEVNVGLLDQQLAMQWVHQNIV
jgi:para-nitrobenzyl esterase